MHIWAVAFGNKWSLSVIKISWFNCNLSPISLTNSQFGESLTLQTSLKSLICLIMQAERGKIAIGENLIKVCVPALLLLSVRLMPNTLPCHPISVRWMQVQHSHHCQIVLQQSPKGKSMHQLQYCLDQAGQEFMNKFSSYLVQNQQRLMLGKEFSTMLVKTVQHFQVFKATP